jgi:hypothetical protein
MNIDVDELQKNLLAAARANKPSDAVPYAFEKRIMARVASRSAHDGWSLWNRALWQAAAPCVAVMLLLGAWTLISSPTESASQSLASDLESAVYAPFDNLGETW